MKRIIAAATATLIATSAISAPLKSPSKAQDPVASFKALVAKAGEQKEWSRVYQNSHSQKWAKQYFTIGEVRYDVRKTESMLNPMIGEVSFPVVIEQSPLFASIEEAEQSTNREPTFTMPYQVEMTYHVNGGVWGFHEMRYQTADRTSPLRGTKFTMDRAKLDSQKSKAIGSAVYHWAW